MADAKHRTTTFERLEVKITLKLFLKTFDYFHVCQAIDVTLEELKINAIEQLIIAFPKPGMFLDLKLLYTK